MVNGAMATAKRLETLLKSKNLKTVAELAEAIGKTEGAGRMWLRGIGPTRHTAATAGVFLGCTGLEFLAALDEFRNRKTEEGKAGD